MFLILIDDSPKPAQNNKKTMNPEDLYGLVSYEDRLARGWDPEILKSYGDSDLVQWVLEYVQNRWVDTRTFDMDTFIEMYGKERFKSCPSTLDICKMCIERQNFQTNRFMKPLIFRVRLGIKNWYEKLCNAIGTTGIFAGNRCIKNMTRSEMCDHGCHFNCRIEKKPSCNKCTKRCSCSGKCGCVGKCMCSKRKKCRRKKFTMPHCYRGQGPSTMRKWWKNMLGYFRKKGSEIFIGADTKKIKKLLVDGRASKSCNKMICHAIESPNVYDGIYTSVEIADMMDKDESIFERFCTDYCDINEPTEKHRANITNHYWKAIGAPLMFNVIHTKDKYEEYKNALYSRKEAECQPKQLSQLENQGYWQNLINEHIDHQAEECNLSDVYYTLTETPQDDYTKNYKKLLKHFSSYEHPTVKHIKETVKNYGSRHNVNQLHKDNLYRETVAPIAYNLLSGTGEHDEHDLFNRMYHGTLLMNPNINNENIQGHLKDSLKNNKTLLEFSKQLDQQFKKKDFEQIKAYVIIPKDKKAFNENNNVFYVSENEMFENKPSVNINSDIGDGTPSISFHTTPKDIKDPVMTIIVNPLKSTWSVKTKKDGVKEKETRLGEILDTKKRVSYLVEY